MKKLFLLVLVLGLHSAACAQFLSVGAKAGISSSKIKWDQSFVDNGNNQYVFNSGDASIGWHAGLYLRMNLLFGLYLQPELLYTRLGGNVTVSVDQNNGSLPQVSAVNFDYRRLDAPIMVGLKFSALRLFAGPVLSYNLEANRSFGDIVEDVTDNYKSSSIGWQGGIGLDIGRFQVDGKYEGSLTKYAERVEDITGFEPDQRSQQWIFSLGYRF